MALFSRDIRHDDEFNIISGETQVVDRLEAIRQQIGLILRTARGELFGDPDFGCNLYTYLYQYEGPALYEVIKQDVADSVNKWDTRVYVNPSEVEVEGDLNERTVSINVRYHIRNTEYTDEYLHTVERNIETYI